VQITRADAFRRNSRFVKPIEINTARFIKPERLMHSIGG
jgi:hypothetical protein